MDALKDLAENILAMINGVGAVITTVLEVNYFLAATVVHLVSRTTSALSTLTCLFYDFLVCSFEDFQFFVTEVFGCLHYLVKFWVRFADEAYGWLTKGVSGVVFALGTIRTEFVSSIGSLATLVDAITRTMGYVAAVFVDALLVLLQCVPYGIVFLVQLLWSGMRWAADSILEFASRTKNSVVRSVLSIVDAVHNIPRDAYIGLATMAVIYVLYRKTSLGYYMSPAKLARMTRKVFRSTLRVATRVTLHRIPNTVRSLARCMMGCLSYFSEVVRSWFTMDGGTEEEDDDDEQEAAQPATGSFQEGATSSNRGEGDKPTSEDRLRKELEQQKERNLCIICQDQPKSVILLPCRHLCLCEECCSELLDRRSTCPLCRTPILSPIQVFV